MDQSLGVRWEHTALTGDCGVQGEPECEHIFPIGVCGGESRSVSLKRTALTGVLSCGEAGGPEAPDEPLPVTPRLPPTPRSGDPRVAGGTARRLTCGGGPPSSTSCSPASRRRPGCQIAAPATVTPRPRRRQEPGTEHSAGLTSPPPRCRLPSVLRGSPHRAPPRPRREPAPGAEGAWPRARGPLIGPARGHSEAPPGSPAFLAEPGGAGSGRRWKARPCGLRSAGRGERWEEESGGVGSGRVAAPPGSEAPLTPRASLFKAEPPLCPGRGGRDRREGESKGPEGLGPSSEGPWWKLRTWQRLGGLGDLRRGHPSSGGAQPRGCLFT